MWRASALAGDTTRARKAFQDFFELWKDADPDIPILQHDKAEYARLRLETNEEFCGIFCLGSGSRLSMTDGS